MTTLDSIVSQIQEAFQDEISAEENNFFGQPASPIITGKEEFINQVKAILQGYEIRERKEQSEAGN